MSILTFKKTYTVNEKSIGLSWKSKAIVYFPYFVNSTKH